MPWLWLGKEGPHPLPEWAFGYLIKTLQVSDADILYCVEQFSYNKKTFVSLIRIFNPAFVPENVKIEDFAFLDEHIELILYEGFREIDSGKIEITTLR